MTFLDLRVRNVREDLHDNEWKFKNYGILPMPKMSAGQEEYCSLVDLTDPSTNLWAIPDMCESVTCAASLFYLTAKHSSKSDSVMDAYCSKTLELSVARDAGSRASLKIVKHTPVYDIGLLYDWGSFATGAIDGIAYADSSVYEDYMQSKALELATRQMNVTLKNFASCAD